METAAVISKVKKSFLAASGLSILALIILIIRVNSQKVQDKPTAIDVKKTFEQTTLVTQNFFLRIYGYLYKTEKGYRLEEGFIPSLTQTLPKDPAQTPYSIVVTEKDGSSVTFYGTGKYCEPTGSDYCISKDALQMPVGEKSLWEPTTVTITESTQSIEIRVQDKTIKTFQKIGGGPSILSFSKKEAIQKGKGKEWDGFEVSWEIKDGDNGTSWPTLEFMKNEDSWEATYGLFTKPETYRSYFVDPQNSFRTTLDNIMLRLLVTDGFYLVQRNLEPIPITLEDNKISLTLSGVVDGQVRTAGQNTNIDVSFMDPQTGRGCNGQGCTFEGSEPRYKVTWFSDKQNICQPDVYNGTLMYFYKKVGKHKIGVRVENIKNPEINAEISATVMVEPSLFPYEDDNPNCSY